MNAGHYYVRATKLAGLREMAVERGVDLAALMLAAGLDPAALKHPEMALDYHGFCELLQGCAVKWDVPDIGIRMAGFQAIDFLGPVALVTRMERTVRGALHAIIANLVIYSNATIVALEEEGDAATMILNRRSDAPDTRENAELIAAQGKITLDAIVAKRVPLIEANFICGQGSSAKAVSAFFDCPIRYDAPRNAFSFERAVLDRPIEKSDLAYHALIKRYLADAHAEVTGNLRENVRAEIARQMEFGQCTLESVAYALRMAPRSLQRQLRSEDTSFRDLLDEWRRERALSMVTNTRLPLSEISHALGYSEQSIFSQAFRRWYGDAPLRIRAGTAPPEA